MFDQDSPAEIVVCVGIVMPTMVACMSRFLSTATCLEQCFVRNFNAILKVLLFV